MTYTVKRGGRVLAYAECEKRPYSSEIEEQMLKSGYEIFVDGRKIRRGKTSEP